jgi:hypothetical protein
MMFRESGELPTLVSVPQRHLQAMTKDRLGDRYLRMTKPDCAFPLSDVSRHVWEMRYRGADFDGARDPRIDALIPDDGGRGNPRSPPGNHAAS